MRYGVRGSARVEAEPKTTANCPVCEAELVPKCGRIKVWHWAHQSADCDPWAEPDNEWHRSWQEQFPVKAREVVIGKHRADLVTQYGVIEIQHSYLSPDAILERENYYGRKRKMTWIWDVTGPYAEGRFDLRDKTNPVARKRLSSHELRVRTFRWKQARKTIVACRRDVWLDLGGGGLLFLTFMGSDAPVGGKGLLYTKDEVIAKLGGGLTQTTTHKHGSAVS